MEPPVCTVKAARDVLDVIEPLQVLNHSAAHNESAPCQGAARAFAPSSGRFPGDRFPILIALGEHIWLDTATSGSPRASTLSSTA
jgi:hypothetical protein